MTYKRKVVIGDCTLYEGDAVAILPVLPPADLCVTDAPYKLTAGGISKSSKTMSGIFAAHNYANDGQLVVATLDWKEMALAIFKALTPDADCYAMTNDKNLIPAGNAFLEAGFSLHNILSWDKVTPTANRWYMKNIEFTIYLWKGRAKTINNPSSKQGISGRQIDQSDHPTEKPVWLMENYITNSSQHGQTVIDPFMGSGTTGVACVNLGRKFIGIELDPDYFDISCERIQKAYDQPNMFVEPPTKATQEDMGL
jgi:DNA modification methylase